MRRIIIFFLIICSTVLFSIDKSNREVVVEGMVTYNGNFTLYNPAVVVFDLSNGWVLPFPLEPDGTFTFTLEPGDYYIYTFSKLYHYFSVVELNITSFQSISGVNHGVSP